MYWVVAADGQRYGPADLPTLRQWCQEGRVTADMSIEDPIDGIVKRARDIPEISQYMRPAGGPPQFRPGTPGYTPANLPRPDYSHVPDAFRSYYPRAYEAPKSKVAAALFAFFLGVLGIHRFYLGHNGTGLAMLLITVLTCGYGTIITGVWALVDFVLILTDALPDANGQRPS